MIKEVRRMKNIDKTVKELWMIKDMPNSQNWITNIWVYPEDVTEEQSIIIDTRLSIMSEDKIKKVLEIANNNGFEVSLALLDKFRIVLDVKE
jgi:hypothetical protein